MEDSREEVRRRKLFNIRKNSDVVIRNRSNNQRGLYLSANNQIFSLKSTFFTSADDDAFLQLQNLFVVDDVSKIIKDTVEQTIGGNAYQNDKVNQWTGTVVETCLQVLTQLQKPYKYIGE